MATPVWPSSLPQFPLINEWNWTPQKNKVSFKPEIGPSIERRRGTAVVRLYNGSFPPLTDAQLITFEDFFHDDLASGVLHYLWLDPVSNINFKWKIVEYRISSLGSSLHDLSIRVNRLPGAAV